MTPKLMITSSALLPKGLQLGGGHRWTSLGGPSRSSLLNSGVWFDSQMNPRSYRNVPIPLQPQISFKPSTLRSHPHFYTGEPAAILALGHHWARGRLSMEGPHQQQRGDEMQFLFMNAWRWALEWFLKCWRPWLGFLELPQSWQQPLQEELQGPICPSPSLTSIKMKLVPLTCPGKCLHQSLWMQSPESFTSVPALPICWYSTHCTTNSPEDLPFSFLKSIFWQFHLWICAQKNWKQKLEQIFIHLYS